MPDIWTFNPEKVKKALITQGAKCEIDARVIKDRDPNWTCHLDLEEINKEGIVGYDIYIHDANSFYTSDKSIALFISIFFSGIALGFILKSLIIKINSKN